MLLYINYAFFSKYNGNSEIGSIMYNLNASDVIKSLAERYFIIDFL